MAIAAVLALYIITRSSRTPIVIPVLGIDVPVLRDPEVVRVLSLS
jgi:hypothetical protein